MPERELRPDFLVIGAQRAGTTWLHRNLSRHRDVWLPPAPLKEIHFFDELHVPGHEHRHEGRIVKLDKYQARLERRGKLTPELSATLDALRTRPRDDEWYRQLFSLAPTRRRPRQLGEITPAYSLLPEDGIRHILAVNPDVRLLLILRHPVDRAWSQVQFFLDRRQRRSADPTSVRVTPYRMRSLALHPDNQSRTDYAAIIGRYRAVVPEPQLRIDFFDRIAADPDTVLADTATYLGVDPGRYNEERLTRTERHNKSAPLEMPRGLGPKLAELYRPTVEWVLDNVDGAPPSWRDRLDHYAGM